MTNVYFLIILYNQLYKMSDIFNDKNAKKKAEQDEKLKELSFQVDKGTRTLLAEWAEKAVLPMAAR